MLNIILTAVVCASPIPVGATQDEVQAADCSFATKAVTANHDQCSVVREAYVATIGKVKFYGYLLCAWDQQGRDPDANYYALPRLKFNKKAGV